MKLFIKVFIAVIFLVLAISPFVSYGYTYEVLKELPSAGGITPGEIQSPAELVKYIYILGLGLGGLLAFAMIVYAGVQWAISAGNVSMASDARDRIQSAVIGLLLLMGAYLILYTINPNLVSLRNPEISPLPTPSFGPSPTPGGGGGTTYTCRRRDDTPNTTQFCQGTYPTKEYCISVGCEDPTKSIPAGYPGKCLLSSQCNEPSTGGPTSVKPFGPPDPYAVDLSGFSAVVQNALKHSPFGSDIGNMDPESRQSLVNMIECAAKVGGSVKVNSAYRPQEYQDHLKEIFCKYSCAFQGKDPETLHKQFAWVNYCSTYANFPCTPGKYDPKYKSALDSISTEWGRHGPLYAPANLGSSHSNGCGVDMSVSGIDPKKYGFMQPLVKDDPVHFNHVFCPDANQVYNPTCSPGF